MLWTVWRHGLLFQVIVSLGFDLVINCGSGCGRCMAKSLLGHEAHYVGSGMIIDLMHIYNKSSVKQWGPGVSFLELSFSAKKFLGENKVFIWGHQLLTAVTSCLVMSLPAGAMNAIWPAIWNVFVTHWGSLFRDTWFRYHLVPQGRNAIAKWEHF